MQHFAGYHNTEVWGPWRTSRKGGRDTFFTAKPYRPDTLIGNCLWAIQAIGPPRRYLLASFGVIERITKRKRPSPYKGSGNVVRFRVHRNFRSVDVTNLSWFQELQKEQQSFRYGLNRVRSKQVIKVLEKLLAGKPVPKAHSDDTPRQPRGFRKPASFDKYKSTVHYILGAKNREITPKHHNFQGRLKRYLTRKGISPELERNFVDVAFTINRTLYVGEIKVTEILDIHQAFRVAIGQLLEYAHLRFSRS